MKEIQINKKCTCDHSTGSTHIECCNICGLPLQSETLWHFFLPEDILSRVQPEVKVNFADDEKIILQSLIRLKILEVQQEIDKDIFASINQQNSLVNKIQKLQEILSKIST